MVVQLLQPLATYLNVDKSAKEAVYLQLAAKLVLLLKQGTLKPGDQLPSTRVLALALDLHRKTVISAYDELLAQGWLESRPGSGTFAAGHLPEIKPQHLAQPGLPRVDPLENAGFKFQSAPHLELKDKSAQCSLHLDDGLPDARLAPLADLSRAYRSQLLLGDPYRRLGYGDTQGAEWLRQELAAYLHHTRGLNVSAANILITRGSIMGLYLACTGLLQQGDEVALGETSWRGAYTNFYQSGAIVHRIPVDACGIQVDALEQLCRQRKLRLVYLTSHHHYPTTVALRADRRLQLLHLANKYGFIIFEDDYDYEFHYENKPLLPLASADQSGMVLYSGSFTKTVSPAFRVGYLVASADVIRHLSRLRRIIDRQGDTMLENAIAELLQNGIIQRHLRKSLRTYRQRRDLFCGLMRNELSAYAEFDVPDGGMAVWTRFDPAIDLVDLSFRALKKDLFFADGRIHDVAGPALNATRLGFASSSATELERCVEILVQLVKQ